MKGTMRCILIAAAVWGIACNTPHSPDARSPEVASVTELTTTTMKSYVAIFEIPVTDMSRAIAFYQDILDIRIEKYEMPDMQIGAFPSDGQSVQGVLMKSQDHKPSANGVTIYLDGGDDLQIILDRVERIGGNIIMPKTQHADESGYFALLMDTEGNRIGLHSTN